MASILDLLNTRNGEHFIAKASKKTSEDKGSVTSILAMGLPILLATLKKNIGSNGGEKELDSALNSKEHGEDFLVNLDSQDPTELISRGDKILDYILKSGKETIFTTISTTLNVKESSVAQTLKMVAPLLMSILASQKRKEELNSRDMGSLLDSVMGSSGEFDPSLIETLLAGKGDANVINDIKGMILGGGNKDKKDGGLLGGMTGGK